MFTSGYVIPTVQGSMRYVAAVLLTADAVTGGAVKQCNCFFKPSTLVHEMTEVCFKNTLLKDKNNLAVTGQAARLGPGISDTWPQAVNA